MDCHEHKNDDLAYCPRCLAEYWRGRAESYKARLAAAERDAERLLTNHEALRECIYGPDNDRSPCACRFSRVSDEDDPIERCKYHGELKDKLAGAEFEIECLRRFGNKDCTAMADAARGATEEQSDA